MYAVILLNDDYTPMDFSFASVLWEERRRINEDYVGCAPKRSGVAGVFTLEVAEMKVMQVNQFSQGNQHPLKCKMVEG